MFNTHKQGEKKGSGGNFCGANEVIPECLEGGTCSESDFFLEFSQLLLSLEYPVA
jgi:hypothetical protein